MESTIKKLIKLAEEIRIFGLKIQQPKNHTEIGNIHFYYADNSNHSSIFFMLQKSDVFSVGFFNPVKIEIRGNVLSTSKLNTLYKNISKEFEDLKQNEISKTIEENNRIKQEKIASLKAQLSRLEEVADAN